MKVMYYQLSCDKSGLTYKTAVLSTNFSPAPRHLPSSQASLKPVFAPPISPALAPHCIRHRWRLFRNLKSLARRLLSLRTWKTSIALVLRSYLIAMEVQPLGTLSWEAVTAFVSPPHWQPFREPGRGLCSPVRHPIIGVLVLCVERLQLQCLSGSMQHPRNGRDQWTFLKLI